LYRRLSDSLEQNEPSFHTLAVLAEIVFAVPRSAVNGNAGTVGPEPNELDRDNIGKAEYRGMLDVDEAPGFGILRHAYQTLFSGYHLYPIIAQPIPRQFEDGASDRFGG
jgi:hypothetical protein